MEFLQSTLEEIVESERLMVLVAKERYGNFYLNARTCSVFLSRCVTEIDHDRMMFGRFLSLMKKHHMLALLSTVRLHKVQAMMNLRQVLEAGAAAAFAIANPEQHHFAETDDDGLLDPSHELTNKRYKWLAENYEDKSTWIKTTKDRINFAAAHANIVSSGAIFQVGDAGDRINAPFFDIEDEYLVKADLWHIASIALSLLDLLYGVNQTRGVITFHDGFASYVTRFAADTDALLAELKTTDRYKRMMQKLRIDEV